MSNVRDMSLADEGIRKIKWVQKHMPVLEHIKKQFEEEKPFEGITIGSCLHLEPKTVNLGLTLLAGGAEVAMTGCNPLSTHDDAAAGAAALGLHIYGWREQTDEEYYEAIDNVLSHKPDVIIDDGADMIMYLHEKRPELLEKIKGACEETTTGVHRLEAMHADGALKFPVIAVNDAYTKYLFDNRYGTGQSSLDAIMGTTNMLIAGKNVVVCGYGWCGRGVASRAAGLGANVIVTEVDPIRALEARMDGYRVMPMAQAAKIGDMFISVTGDKHVVDVKHILTMKDGAMVANAGHFDWEVNVNGLKEYTTEIKKIRPYLDEYKLNNGKSIYVLADGRLVNLGAAEGHPASVMDMSFANQALGMEYIVKNQGKLANKLHTLPESVDMSIAQLKLKTMGIEIDILTPEQEEYLNSWKL